MDQYAKSEKFRRNFRDTSNPMYPKNDGVEDTEYYLPYCHSYNAYRRDLLNSVNSTLLPYGLLNISNALLRDAHDDSNSKSLKVTLKPSMQQSVLDKIMLFKLSFCNL